MRRENFFFFFFWLKVFYFLVNAKLKALHIPITHTYFNLKGFLALKIKDTPEHNYK